MSGNGSAIVKGSEIDTALAPATIREKVMDYSNKKATELEAEYAQLPVDERADYLKRLGLDNKVADLPPEVREKVLRRVVTIHVGRNLKEFIAGQLDKWKPAYAAVLNQGFAGEVRALGEGIATLAAQPEVSTTHENQPAYALAVMGSEDKKLGDMLMEVRMGLGEIVKRESYLDREIRKLREGELDVEEGTGNAVVTPIKRDGYGNPVLNDGNPVHGAPIRVQVIRYSEKDDGRYSPAEAKLVVDMPEVATIGKLKQGDERGSWITRAENLETALEAVQAGAVGALDAHARVVADVLREERGEVLKYFVEEVQRVAAGEAKLVEKTKAADKLVSDAAGYLAKVDAQRKVLQEGVFRAPM